MNIDETREKILSDDQFVLDELARIQKLYELKRVIRYHFERNEEVDTESVAEHVYAMHVLVQYFLPLEDLGHTADRDRITAMVQFHDIDEIITGDMIGYMKTDADRAREADAQTQVVAELPDSMREHVQSVLEEYEAQETFEARFVKAIDRIEPSFHLLSETGKAICDVTKPKRAQHQSIKEEYTKPFPTIYRFNKIIEEEMYQQGFYSGDA